jgi:hypothetical protein
MSVRGLSTQEHVSATLGFPALLRKTVLVLELVGTMVRISSTCEKNGLGSSTSCSN